MDEKQQHGASGKQQQEDMATGVELAQLWVRSRVVSAKLVC